MLLSRLLASSGGLEWHGRALRHRNRLWAGFRDDLREWLGGWQPARDDLLLIGASAGWCLPDDFLTRFRRIDALDLDPLASVLFRANHGRALAAAGRTLRFSRTDALADLSRLLAEHPRHAVLFANILGQRRFDRADGTATEAELAALASRLAGRPWASFHDRLSGRARDVAAAPQTFSCATRLAPEELARRVGASGEWLDHLTTDVLPATTERRVMPWRFRPGRLHWVEAGFV